MRAHIQNNLLLLVLLLIMAACSQPESANDASADSEALQLVALPANESDTPANADSQATDVSNADEQSEQSEQSAQPALAEQPVSETPVPVEQPATELEVNTEILLTARSITQLASNLTLLVEGTGLTSDLTATLTDSLGTSAKYVVTLNAGDRLQLNAPFSEFTKQLQVVQTITFNDDIGNATVTFQELTGSGAATSLFTLDAQGHQFTVEAEANQRGRTLHPQRTDASETDEMVRGNFADESDSQVIDLVDVHYLYAYFQGEILHENSLTQEGMSRSDIVDQEVHRMPNAVMDNFTFKDSEGSDADFVIDLHDVVYLYAYYQSGATSLEDLKQVAQALFPQTLNDPAFLPGEQISQSLSITGTYQSGFGELHQVSSYYWNTQSYYELGGVTYPTISRNAIYKINAEEQYLIVQNDLINDFNPGKFSRFDWTLQNDTLYYCQTTFDSQSPSAAEAADLSDDSNPATSGCGTSNFSWTTLSSAAMPISGEYTDQFSGSYEVGYLTWETFGSLFHVLQINLEEGYLIALNDKHNSYFPNLFSRFDWVQVEDQQYYCQSSYDAATASEASANAVVDSSDPSNSGCGASGFSWSELIDSP